jgi:hypothetical protein
MAKQRKLKLQAIPEGYGSATELAKRIGVTRGRVSQLQKEGVFGETFHRLNNGRFIVDLDAAVQKFKDHADPSKRTISTQMARQNVLAPPAERPAGTPLPPDTIPENEDMSFVTARALKERYCAQIKKLEFEEKVGKLLQEEDVKRGAFEMYRKTRDTLINLIDRISAQLAAEKNESVVRVILETEIRSALSHIRGDFDA